MRVSSIHIDGFGIFSNEAISGLESGLVLFQGNNEAGKSTLLGFIRTILFGFPRANSRDPNYPPLNGGSPGGRIGLLMNSGEEFVVERRPGKRGGPVIISGPNARTGGVELLQQLLSGVTYDVFKNIYAFSLAELQTIETLNAENIKSVIYGAGAGAGMMTLPKANKKIRDRLKNLFRPGGKKPVINQLMVQLEHIRSEIRETSKGISKYDQVVDEARQVDEKIRSLQHNLAGISQDKSVLSSYARLWPEWIALKEGKKALYELEEVVELFPENGNLRLEKELSSLNNHEDRLVDLQNDLQKLQNESEGLPVDESLIAQDKNISFLLEKKSEYLEKLKLLPLKQQEKEVLNTEIGGLIGGLGKDWSEKRVFAIDRSLFTREGIRKHEDRLNKMERNLFKADGILTDKRHRYDKSLQEELDSRETLQRLGLTPTKINEEIILKLQHGRDEFAGTIRDIPRRNSELHQEQQNLDRLIREIDPDWSGHEINNFDNSIAARKKVEEFAARLKRDEAALRDAKIFGRTIENDLNTMQEKHESAISALQDIPGPTVSSADELDKTKACIFDLKKNHQERTDLAHEIRHNEERLLDKQKELDRLKKFPSGISEEVFKWMAGMFAVLGVMLPGALYLYGMYIDAGIIAGIVLLTVAVVFIVIHYRFNRRSKPGLKGNQPLTYPVEQEINRIETELNANREKLREVDLKIARLAEDMNLSGSITNEHLVTLEDKVGKNIRFFERRSNLEKEIKALDTDVRKLEKKFFDAKEKIDQCNQSISSLLDNWKGHLETNNLSGELTPELAIVIFSKVETARQQLNNTKVLKERILEMEKTRDNYFALVKAVPDLSKFCQGPGTDLLFEVDKFFSQLKKQQKQLEAYRRVQQDLEDKCRHTADDKNSLDKAEKTRDQTNKALSDSRRDWHSWLTKQGLPGDLLPKTALEGLDKINACVEKINKRDFIITEISNLEIETERYRIVVNETLSKLGLSAPDIESIAMLVDRLVSKLDLARGNQRERSRIKTQMKTTETQLESVQGLVTQCQERISRLLKEGGTNNKDEFRKREHLFLERKRLLSEIAQAEKNMRRISGESDIDS
ncbi:MAG TPA: hypothetical protein DDW42_07060, partial [Desulfobacteraceae bacterium]|nr:hypothetical protein [Desulfobacteraceae bacterium]